MYGLGTSFILGKYKLMQNNNIVYSEVQNNFVEDKKDPLYRSKMKKKLEEER
jgi:hypothetical protein